MEKNSPLELTAVGLFRKQQLKLLCGGDHQPSSMGYAAQILLVYGQEFWKGILGRNKYITSRLFFLCFINVFEKKLFFLL